MIRPRRQLALALLLLTPLGGCLKRSERTVRRASATVKRQAKEEEENLPSRATFAGSAACRDCHEEKYARWSRDWHARAFSPAEAKYVVGDFRNAHYRGTSSEASMSRRGESYVMHTRGADGKAADFPVSWVIGGKRMQDTVTEFPDGRWQVLPVYFHITGHSSWVDYNEKKQGLVTPQHPFYWTNFRRTANRECLECHTTGLDVRYDRTERRWSTEFADAGVACESCHGPGARHAETKEKSDIVHPGHLDPTLALAICANCHGPRDPLFPALDRRHRFRPGDRYEDKYQPLVIVDGTERSGEFFADGRPSSSSFEYQALLQSRCHLQGGATCLSCHTAPHQDHGANDLRKPKVSMTLEDAGCRTCHATLFAGLEQHSHHKSAAAQSCVSCHMPKIVNGVLDKFADHTLDIPNPAVTIRHDVPNACNNCHEKESPQSMQAAMERWWPATPQRQERRSRLGDAVDEKTAAESLPALRAVIYDRREAAILRGACAILLGQRFPAAAAATLVPLLDDRSALVRSRFIEALGHAAARDAAEAVATHLDDNDSVAVRQMAAMVLASFGDSRGFAALQKLANDPATSALVRPHVMLADQLSRMGKLDAARAELEKALAEMPYLSDALVMLADVEIRQGHVELARADLEEALRFSPSHPGARKRLEMMK